MRSLVSYFGCGRYTARSNKPLGEYECTKLSDINDPPKEGAARRLRGRAGALENYPIFY